MPIREDLLEPIEGDSPSGPNLYYDKVFEQIKEARVEDDDSIPTGDWARAPKKADRVFVIKQAGDTLAKRSKDLRLAGWYVESVLRKEGFGQLVGGIELLWKLQDQFWETLHPELDDDGNADIRIGAAEAASNLIGLSVQALPLTRSGFNFGQYGDARALGYDADERSDERQAARQDAISLGRATADDLLKALNGTPKAFYVETDATLARALEVLDELERFQEEKYGNDYPSMSKLKSAMEDVKRVVGSVLAEKRKTEPDAVAEEPAEEVEEAVAEEVDPFAQYDAVAEETPEATVFRAVAAPARKKVAAGVPTDAEGAYAQVGASAEFLRGLDAASPVAYLLCSGLRLGETRGADLCDGSFAVAPATETRQALRRLANEGSWDELMALCLRTMAEPCGRVWLDLQRFTWRAAYANGQYAVATAVASTVRALLVDLPDLRTMTLDDDTPAANAETQAWIDAEVLPPVAEVVETSAPEPEPEPVYTAPGPLANLNGAGAAPDIYETALGVLKQGRMGEAIQMLVRDSELQPSGRARFHRRVQMAQLCLAADQAAVAYPVLRDLSSEIERRALETWESGEMLAQPLSLLLRCLQQRKGTEEEREAIFDRLCRLDPQAALGAKR